MPSQSSSEGEAMPDHWMRIGSPDLARAVGVTERETWDGVDGSKRDKIRKRRKGARARGFIFGFLSVDEDERVWDLEVRWVKGIIGLLMTQIF